MAGIETVNHQAAAQARLAPGQATDQAGATDSDDSTAPTAPDATAGEAGDSGPVQITLSEEAQEFLAGDEVTERPGKSGQSPAHRARAALDLEEFSALRGLPFGRIVSTLARFGDLSSLLPPPEPASETGEPGETGDTGETGETGDPVAVPAIEADATLDDAALALQILQVQDTADPLSQ